MSRPKDAGLRAGEITLCAAAQRLKLGDAAVLALIQSKRLVGGVRTVRRASPLRPWSRAPRHRRFWVMEDSVVRFEHAHAGELADLQARRMRRAAAAHSIPAEVAA